MFICFKGTKRYSVLFQINKNSVIKILIWFEFARHMSQFLSVCVLINMKNILKCLCKRYYQFSSTIMFSLQVKSVVTYKLLCWFIFSFYSPQNRIQLFINTGACITYMYVHIYWGYSFIFSSPES